MMENECLMQCFEWYLRNDGKHWNRIKREAPHLNALGIKKFWLPPAFKATSSNDVGYGVYDLFDLGEFYQKGTIRTKYGTKEEYIEMIATLNSLGMEAIADVVLNHKAAADELEEVEVLKMDPNNRQQPISDPYSIYAWTKFTFPGRKGVYNDFQWNHTHFTGTDYDAKNNESGIYMILGENKGWAHDDSVDDEHGNYDYLMYTDIDFKNPEVLENIYTWVDWFIENTGIKGFRMDAVKHIDSKFMLNFTDYIMKKYPDNFYIFGEHWRGDYESNENYLETTNYNIDLVDVVLHNNFYDVGKNKDSYDLTNILDNTLMKENPTNAVTFVDNHDTQRGQALESTVEKWFKVQAYAIILLRSEGLPCIFYGDYYGIKGKYKQQSFKEDLDILLLIRKEKAYGKQIDYFDNQRCIGWSRLGTAEHPDSIAVLINNGEKTSKRMYVGEFHAGKKYVDLLGNSSEEIIIEEDGWATFFVENSSLAVWGNINT